MEAKTTNPVKDFVNWGAGVIGGWPGAERAHAFGKWLAQKQERIEKEFRSLMPDQSRATNYKDTQLDHTVRVIKKGPQANVDRFDPSEQVDLALQKPAQWAA